MKFLTRFSKRATAGESNIARALKAVVKGDNSSTRRNLYQALKNQRLILPLSKTPENVAKDAMGRLLRDVHLDFLSCKDENGRKFLAVFTNPDALKKWKSDVPTLIAIDTPSLCRFALESGHPSLQVNPGSDTFVELKPEEVRILAAMEAGQ